MSTRAPDRRTGTGPSTGTGPTRRDVTIMGLALAAGAVAAPAWAQQAGRPALPPLIPRAAMFGNPDKTSVQLSNDGRFLAWLAPANGVLNVHVAPDRRSRGGAPGHERHASGRSTATSGPTTTAPSCIADDVGGDENIRIFAVDTVTLAKRDLTPLAGVKAAAARRHRPSTARASPSASTTATRSGTTSGISTSPPASAVSCARTATRSRATSSTRT